MRIKYTLATVCIFLPIVLSAQEADTLASKAGKSNRNVMLNAESATVPREINIGLPDSGDGAVVYVDGMKHAAGVPRGQYHWSGGNAYEPIQTFSIIESLIYTGEIGIVVDSRTRLGRDTLAGAVTVSTSTNGLARIDAAVNGPVANTKGWHFATGAYANFDPTSVNAPGRTFVEQKQIYQMAVSKRWTNARFMLGYKLSFCNDNVENGYGFAPFIFDGKGGISPYNGFRLGRDCYMPENDNVRWMDIRTGEMKQGRLGSLDSRTLHDVTAKYGCRTSGGWELSASLHFCRMSPSLSSTFNLSSITSGTGNFTLENGVPYTGQVQNRFVTVYDEHTSDTEILLAAKRKFSNHDVRVGADVIYADQYTSGATFNIAHTVEANPARLLINGNDCWDYNTSAVYYDGLRRNYILYGMDEWRVTRDLRLRTGVRLNRVDNVLNHAPYNPETGYNDRSTGHFYLENNNCGLIEKKIKGLDYAITEEVSLHLVDRLFFTAEGFYSITNKTNSYFKGAAAPSEKAIGNAYARAGLSYDNEWMDVTGLFSFITSWNNAKVMTVSNPDTGESLPWTAQYGVRTPGFTVDGNLHFGGFKLHLLGTLQDPRYKNYKNVFEFSTGTKVIDYTGNICTGISRFMVEFDPSYTFGRHRFWASARYYSKQYASRTNYAYFNGHFETFAGTDVKLSDRSNVSLNVVNVLCQNGAKGSVDFLDAIDNPDALTDYLISGTFIRPFTVELSYNYSF